MAEKNFIGFDEAVLSGLQKDKKYYMEMTGKGKIITHETIIPISDIQNRILTTESNFTILNPKVDNLETKVNNLENVDRIKAFKNTNLILTTSPLVINFDQILVNANITCINGVFTTSKNGSYIIELDTFINQTASPNIWFCIEHKPYGLAKWSVYRNLGTLLKITADGTYVFNLNSTMYLGAGDQFRLITFIEGSGNAILESRSTVVNGITIYQNSAMATIFKI